MCKTVSTCILETNLEPNRPQENIFFHTLYRTMADFPAQFVRTARSNSPIQVVAIFSTQGPDTNAAMLNIELNEQLSKIVSDVSGQPVLDFESFSNKVINSLNVHVCNFIVTHGGNPLRTSMTMAVIEGDTLRVVHVGNTKAVLVRGGRIMALTEEQTVAQRYVQMGAISAEQEATHPDRFTLTQYLGKMPQDGQVMADKKVHLKLSDNDSICLMGLGLSKMMPARNRNSILVKTMSTEAKCREVINAAGAIGIKFGLSLAVVDVESTLVLPGEAFPASGAASSAADTQPFVNSHDPFGDFNSQSGSYSGYSSYEDPAGSDTAVFDAYDDDEDYAGRKQGRSPKKKKGSAGRTFIIALLIFIVFAALSFAALYYVFIKKGMIELNSVASEVYVDTVLYSADDYVRVYVQASEDSSVIATLSKGDVVQFVEDAGSYSKITTTSGVTGYVLSVNLVTESPEASVETTAELPPPEDEADLEFVPDEDPEAGETTVLESSEELSDQEALTEDIVENAAFEAGEGEGV